MFGFPAGKTILICACWRLPVSAEYWDSSGLEGLKYLYEGLRANWQKRTPEHDDAQHAKVSL